MSADMSIYGRLKCVLLSVTAILKFGVIGKNAKMSRDIAKKIRPPPPTLIE